MKTVWTYVILTFVIFELLYLSGAIEASDGYSVIGLVNSIMSGGSIASSGLWLVVAGIIGTMGAISLANAFTGGNASVGVTAGYAAFATWCLGLIFDWVNLIKNTKNDCAIEVSGLCSFGYWSIYIFGVILLVGFVFALMDLVGGND